MQGDRKKDASFNSGVNVYFQEMKTSSLDCFLFFFFFFRSALRNVLAILQVFFLW